MDFAQDWVLALGSSPWVYVALFLFCAIDGIFPPVPSESLVVALGATWAAVGVPDVWLVVLVAAGGAFTGDQVAYTIGRHVEVRRLRLFRGSRAHRVLDWAQHALDTRGASFIIAARFVPVGRVAVNMSAGSSGVPVDGLALPRRRRPSPPRSGRCTASPSGSLSTGAWFRDRPLLAVPPSAIAAPGPRRSWTGAGPADTPRGGSSGGPRLPSRRRRFRGSRPIGPALRGADG